MGTLDSVIHDDQQNLEPQDSKIVKRRSSIKGASHSAITDVTTKERNSPATKS
jgi:hypothetical protein